MINLKIKTMKKLILIPLILLSFMMNAQEKLVLTENGFRTVSGKDYIILNYPGKSQKELFNLFLTNLSAIYISPKDAINSVPNSMINITGFARNVCKKGYVHYDSYYTVVFQFKDGKVKINVPEMVGTNGEIARNGKYFIYLKGHNDPGIVNVVFSIWNKKGKLKNEKFKTSIENYFNSYLADIIKEVNKKEAW